jgi:hypothetical protein
MNSGEVLVICMNPAFAFIVNKLSEPFCEAADRPTTEVSLTAGGLRRQNKSTSVCGVNPPTFISTFGFAFGMSCDLGTGEGFESIKN